MVSPQALLQPFAVAVDQRVVRPGDRGARAQQDQRVEQRQVERIEHVHAFGELAGSSLPSWPTMLVQMPAASS
jgi:hypothetical protein